MEYNVLLDVFLFVWCNNSVPKPVPFHCQMKVHTVLAVFITIMLPSLHD